MNAIGKAYLIAFLVVLFSLLVGILTSLFYPAMSVAALMLADVTLLCIVISMVVMLLVKL